MEVDSRWGHNSSHKEYLENPYILFLALHIHGFSLTRGGASWPSMKAGEELYGMWPADLTVSWHRQGRTRPPSSQVHLHSHRLCCLCRLCRVLAARRCSLSFLVGCIHDVEVTFPDLQAPALYRSGGEPHWQVPALRQGLDGWEWEEDPGSAHVCTTSAVGSSRRRREGLMRLSLKELLVVRRLVLLTTGVEKALSAQGGYGLLLWITKHRGRSGCT